MEKHFLNKIEPLIPYLCQAKHTGISTSETFYINWSDICIHLFADWGTKLYRMAALFMDCVLW